MMDIHVQETSATSQTIVPRIKPSPKSSKLVGQFFYAPSDDGTDENLLILLHGLGLLEQNGITEQNTIDDDPPSPPPLFP